jgi:hypothetical protein
MQTNPAEVTVTGMLIECDIDPLTPVTCTENVPDVLPVTVRVAVPEPVTLVGLIVAVIPDDAVTVRDTIPENPLSAVTIIVEETEEPGENVMLEGLADKEKSGGAAVLTVTWMVTLCEIEPLAPVTVTVYVPEGVVLDVNMVRVEDATPPEERAMFVGLSVAVGPAGEMAAERLTVPAKPLRLVSVMVEDPVDPAVMLRLFGLAVTA